MKFGKLKYCENRGDHTVYSFTDVIEKDYFGFLSSLSNKGYRNVSEYSLGSCSTTVLDHNGDMLMATYFPGSKETQIVTEPKSSYPSFKDHIYAPRVPALITQIDLEDFGASVVFRIPDGRFIIFDGGWHFEPDADKLVHCLKEQSPTDIPVIAAWIFTHPHCDHYRCFSTACEKHAGAFTVERIIYNFIDVDSNAGKFSDLAREKEELLRFDGWVKNSGATVYKAHTGQLYRFGDASLEMLSTPDDSCLDSVANMNELSLVVRVNIAGQRVMMCADANLKALNLVKRYGEYLKSDILQPTHHMFNGGDVATYDLIDPSVCVTAGFEEHCLGTFSLYQQKSKEACRHLLYNMRVEDFFAGGHGNVVLALPYSPRHNGKQIYMDKLKEYSRKMGAESWFFSDMSASDCTFTLTNVSFGEAEVNVDLYGDSASSLVCGISFKVSPKSTKTLNILDTGAVNPDALYYNPFSLSKNPLKDGARFTVNLKSNIPIVVSGKKPADYHS